MGAPLAYMGIHLGPKSIPLVAVDVPGNHWLKAKPVRALFIKGVGKVYKAVLVKLGSKLPKPQLRWPARMTSHTTCSCNRRSYEQ